MHWGIYRGDNVNGEQTHDLWRPHRDRVRRGEPARLVTHSPSSSSAAGEDLVDPPRVRRDVALAWPLQREALPRAAVDV